jgi:hypothetical protein
MLDAVLQGALTSEQRACGFRVVVPDDTVELRLKSETIARFTTHVTLEEIRAAAETAKISYATIE